MINLTEFVKKRPADIRIWIYIYIYTILCETIICRTKPLIIEFEGEIFCDRPLIWPSIGRYNFNLLELSDCVTSSAIGFDVISRTKSSERETMSMRDGRLFIFINVFFMLWQKNIFCYWLRGQLTRNGTRLTKGALQYKISVRNPY